MTTPRSRLFSTVLPICMAALALAACSGATGDAPTGAPPAAEDAETGTPDDAGVDGGVELTWGYSLPDSAPVLLGIDNGVFEERGITITTREAGGADLIGGLLSGDLDLSVNTGPGLALASSQGIRTVAISGVTTFEAGAEGSSGAGLLVSADSDIETPSDLEGKTVGVNLLASASEYGVRQMVQDDGGDPSTVQIVEVPFQAAADSLSRGDIDAVLVAEPFLTQMLDAGDATLPMGDPIERAFGSSPRLVITATQEWVDQNPDVVNGLQEGIAESLRYAEDNPDELHRIFEEYFGMTPELAQSTHLNALSADIDAGSFDRINDVLVEFGAYSEPVTVEDLVAP